MYHKTKKIGTIQTDEEERERERQKIVLNNMH